MCIGLIVCLFVMLQTEVLRLILTGILTGIVLSSNGICLNTQLAVKVNIFSFANIGVLKL